MDERVLSLVGPLYDAACDRDRWPAFLEGLNRALDASASAFIDHDLREGGDHVAAAVGLSPDELARFTEVAHLNPWVDADRGRMRSGRVVTGQSLISDAELRRTEFYAHCLRPRLSHMLGGSVFTVAGVTTANITVHRDERVAAFGESEIVLLQALMPHLQRATQIHRRLAGSDAARQAAEVALDHLVIGVILVGADATVRFANRAARAILDGRDGLSIAFHALRASGAHDTAALRRLIGEAARTTAGIGAHSGGCLALGRPSLRRPLGVVVAPVGAAVSGVEGAEAVVFVTDPETAPETPADALMRMYQLTPTEARVAAALITGCTLREIAERTGISVHTARTHERRVLAKTGARRQSELVTLMIRGPAALRLRDAV